MRLIQFNSGLCVVLKDVQQRQTEHLQEYYLSAPQPAYHSSNSSIATTSSSIKSNGSVGINNGYHIHRPFPPPPPSSSSLHVKIHHQQINRVKISSIINKVPSMIIVEVAGISHLYNEQIHILSYDLCAYVYACVCVTFI